MGAGPAGLEAARVAAARGHEVVLFEAAAQPGGQIRLAARARRRAELLGIVDWRIAQCEQQGVALRCNRLAEAADVLAEEPDVVIVATGGLPHAPPLAAGADLVVSSWDILSGDARPGQEVLLYDDNGAHPGLQAAEQLAAAGAKLEIVTPERFFAPEIGGLNHVAYARCFQEHGVRITINSRLRAVRRAGNRLAAEIGSDYAERTEERLVDQVVVEHGTLPQDELYFALKEQSDQPRRGRLPGADRRPAPEPGRQPRGPLPAVPHRGCGREPQHPRRDLRCAAPVQGSVGLPSGGIRRRAGPLFRRD